MDPMLERELRIRAIQSAVEYCKLSPNEDLLMVAEKIFQFLVKKTESEK